MKKVVNVLFFSIALGAPLAAQSKYYFVSCERADSLFNTGHYNRSANLYSSAIASFGGKAHVNDRFRAACSWAMANEPDSALYHLEILTYKDRYGFPFRIDNEPSFNFLHHKLRYQNLMDTAKFIAEAQKIKKVQYDKSHKDLFEPELAARLDTVHNADHFYRYQLEDIEKRYGRNSKELKQVYSKMKYQDSINLILVKHILDTRGWLGPEIVHSGSETLFLVIQHSDVKTQTQYLPMMREATQNGKLQKSSLAMLEDRILLRQNKKQIYGTQIRRDSISGQYYVSPLIDPDNVDKRRAEVGLGTISDYVSHWDLLWDPEAYKKEMAKREK